VATTIHELSRRRHRRLVVVNCGAIPEGLIESELFGAEKGAYTGSVERRTGLFEEADGGTIFLDEIGEMPAPAQVRLLRVLESGHFSRVGSSTVLQTDARVIAATNKDLGAEVRAGRFREDLYYRLSAVITRIPPLRQRREDVMLLFDHYVRRFAQQYDRRPPLPDTEARALLTRYDWPGNIRELRNVAEQTVVLVRSDIVTADALRPFLRGVSAGTGLAVASRNDGLDSSERELIYRALLELRVDVREVKALLKGGASPASGEQRALPPHVDAAVPDATSVDRDEYELLAQGEDASGTRYEAADVDYEVDAEPADLASDFAGALRDGLPLPTMEEAERALIMEGLHRFDGNRRLTAEALGISERTLYRKIKELEAADE
jgi:DNA-binding NtrC family response regulator